ncbi:Glycosyltransferase, group 1 family protein [Serratia proteamaculans]|uniref:glycosyltransferase family 4 protein n=1 Tax=Serratia proteamaculans TaxID=28151 RepID=UPI0009F7F22A|nr:glycosyltransferase family 1 protein [Serratia proteamaculans]SMB29441.1 Glycosyltransferase, group 1 family protein [Serratia proteamaculans]
MIYINARFLTQEMTGVQRFAEEISLSLTKIRNDLVFLSPRGILRQDVADRLNVRVIGSNYGHLWEQYDLVKYLSNEGNPLLLNLTNTAPLFYKNKVVTHHDITYKRYPQSYSLKFRFFYNALIPLMINSSHAVVTVSDFSKNEISEVYGCSLDKIHVIYNSVSNKFEKYNTSECHYPTNRERYFLAVSSVNYHKNFDRMLQAFLLSKAMSMGFTIKIIGSNNKNFNSLSNSFISDKIQYLGRVSDSELYELYTQAYSFIFPSLYEGFGIPPLEAQACDCPVIASNAASIPEVLGNSVIYFSPFDIDEMKERINILVENSDIGKELIIKGRHNIARFSWDKSAEKLSYLLDDISSQ